MNYALLHSAATAIHELIGHGTVEPREYDADDLGIIQPWVERGL
jgi:hypothetical protein